MQDASSIANLFSNAMPLNLVGHQKFGDQYAVLGFGYEGLTLSPAVKKTYKSVTRLLMLHGIAKEQRGAYSIFSEHSKSPSSVEHREFYNSGMYHESESW